MKHRLLFFIASSYHNQANYQQVGDDSELRKKETEFYAKAAQLRTSMLKQYERIVNDSKIHVISKIAKNQDVFDLESYEPLSLYGGIYTTPIFDDIAELDELLTKQWDCIHDRRVKLVKLLTAPLEEQTDGDNEAPTGEEFNAGVENQDAAMAYQVHNLNTGQFFDACNVSQRSVDWGCTRA